MPHFSAGGRRFYTDKRLEDGPFRRGRIRASFAENVQGGNGGEGYIASWILRCALRSPAAPIFMIMRYLVTVRRLMGKPRVRSSPEIC